MTVDISNFIIATPLPISDTNPISLDLIGGRALIECPSVISMLPDGSLQMTAPTLGASSKSVHRTRCEWKEPGYWLLAVCQCRRPLVPSRNAADEGQFVTEDRDRPNSCAGLRTPTGKGVLEQRQNHHGVPVELPARRSGQLDGTGKRAARRTLQDQHSREFQRCCIGICQLQRRQIHLRDHAPGQHLGHEDSRLPRRRVQPDRLLRFDRS